MNIQKKVLNIVTITTVLLICCARHAFAFDLDLTVDDDIRKNYNSSQLIKDTNTEELDEKLPDLPIIDDISPQTTTSKPTKTTNLPPIQTISQNNNGIKINKGATFNVVSLNKISDWQKRGTTVKFKTNTPISKRKYTIPSGTVFVGEIIEVHQPQISCNGGLVVIRILSMNYKGQTIPISGYLTRADDKIIFLNNIKGERTYLKTVWKKGNWGRSIFNRMMTLTVNLGGDGSTLILAPFPFLYGSLCLGTNAIFSPITAFFQKGGHVSINSGSRFRIKLLEDAYL